MGTVLYNRIKKDLIYYVDFENNSMKLK